jgi:hypothetical protein
MDGSALMSYFTRSWVGSMPPGAWGQGQLFVPPPLPFPEAVRAGRLRLAPGNSAILERNGVQLPVLIHGVNQAL